MIKFETKYIIGLSFSNLWNEYGFNRQQNLQIACTAPETSFCSQDSLQGYLVG